MKRVFLGIDLPEKLKEKIQKLKMESGLKALPIKLVEPENSHIAIKFLDELSDVQIEQLDNIVNQTIAGFKSFEIKIENVLAFPNFFQPRVLSLKINSINLEGLVKKLSSNFSQLDFISDEEKKYTPHITLGRIKDKLSKIDSEKIAKIIYVRSS